jgi:protease-4
VAEGSITDGHSGPGSIGGLSTSELVRQARDDPQVKAVVLRVNSPGGSAFASELIRHQLELTRKAGKPVVVSMGDVAASGGYWIATASDEMLADAGTITGSIGVIAMLPTARQGLDKLGISTAGVSTTWLGGSFDPRRDLDPRLERLVQAGIDQTYRQFIEHVVVARKSTPEKIAAVAQGRVWTGSDALANGLVDRLGSLGDALKVAASRAKLEAGYRVQYIEAPPGRLQLWLQRLGVQFDVAGFVGRSGLQAMTEGLGLPGATIALGLMPPVAARMADDIAWLADQTAARKPFSALVHCLCSAP